MQKDENFAGMSLDPRLLRAVTDLGFTRPTPIQTAAIPAGLEGRDVLGSAATGSGKTAAFVLPILDRLLKRNPGATRALVLVPTRELAAQVEEHARELARHTRLTTAAIYGGVAMGPQVNAFKRGVDLLVATPGRLLDHFGREHGGLEAIEALVLDEADRMLDMGFLPEIRKILRHLPNRPRQTFFFSATMPAEIVRLADEMLKTPIRIEVERKQAPAAGVLQAFYPVAQTAKVPLLLELLKRGEVGNAIVFTRTKHRANRVAQKLERAGVRVARIHGNRSQKQRTEALAGFKGGRFQVLVATDILARGIDVEALEHVVNFDVPASVDDYIHRVGRTGRAELTGDAYTFVTPEDRSLVQAIERKVGRAIERRTLPDFDYSAASAEPLEVPLQERLAKVRAERAEARRRAAEKAERKAGNVAANAGHGNGNGRNGARGNGAGTDRMNGRAGARGPDGSGGGRGSQRGGRSRRGGRSGSGGRRGPGAGPRG